MGSERTDVEFTSDGVVIRAWLYRPNVPNPPIIVMAHGLGGVKTMRLDAFAERFADAGYACLVFDYRHFGDSDGEPRQLLSVHRQLADYDAAITYAKSLDGVDAARVVVWGIVVLRRTRADAGVAPSRARRGDFAVPVHQRYRVPDRT